MHTFLLIVTTLCYGSLMYFYARSWRQMATTNLQDNYVCKTAVSVIIPARNEASNLQKLIPILLHQKYSGPLLEIIVVNDHSTDATLEILKQYGFEIIIINLVDEIQADIKLQAYKKKAIEVAIQKASGNLIITTDADCTMPLSWVESIVQFYETKKPKIIAGPVNYNKATSIQSIFESLDFLTMQGITGASIFRHFNSTCNGANLAYSKKVFNEVGGFAGIDNIASGDDMLLLHKIESKYPKSAAYIKNPQAIVSTNATESLQAFLQQRIRWASKAKHFADKRVTLVLGFVYLYNLLLLLLLVRMFLGKYNIIIGLVFFTIKVIFEFMLLTPVLEFFKQKSLQKYFVPLQPLHLLYMVGVGFLGLFKKYNWKGRTVS